MQYFSLDIETTGLNRDMCDVLQIAIVRDEINGTEQPPVEDLPYFEAIIKHDKLLGEPYALALNVDLIRTIANWDLETGSVVQYHDRNVLVVESLEAMVDQALAWLRQFPTPWIVAGKNVAGFDLRFLPETLTQEFHHRTIDAGSVSLGARPDYWHRNAPPGLSALETENPHPHDALEDARSVVRVLRRLYIRGE
jgi:oligoribonuclease (3'-5' exoribonuclease)